MNRVTKRRGEVGLTQTSLWIHTRRILDLFDPGSVRDQVRQALSRTPLFAGVILVLRSTSPPVRLTVEIQTQSSAYDDQPGRESTSTIRREPPQPPTVVTPKPFQDERVRVHRAVVAASERMGDMKDELGVNLHERRPCIVELVGSSGA
jgi:hypothetical protein